jgi:hypothetical protein
MKILYNIEVGDYVKLNLSGGCPKLSCNCDIIYNSVNFNPDKYYPIIYLSISKNEYNIPTYIGIIVSGTSFPFSSNHITNIKKGYHENYTKR